MSESARDRMRKQAEQGPGDEFVANPDELAIAPQLADLMCRFYENGKRCETATLALWCDDGRWKCRITDRETKLTLWHTLDDPKLLFQELEERLISDNPDWKVDKRQPR